VVHDRGIPNFQMHVFSKSEISYLLTSSGFTIETFRPLNSTASGPLSLPWLGGGLRANGWIIIARDDRL
jgi:hypothetical protein